MVVRIITMTTILVGLILATGPHPSGAGEQTVPLDLQISIFLKILTYDRALHTKAPSGVRIGIVYCRQKKSEQIKDELSEILASLSDKTVNELPLTFTNVEFVSGDQLAEFIGSDSVNVLYITPGLGKNISAIAKVCRAQKVLTFAGIPQYVEQGLSVGLELAKDKARILINLSASKAEGSDFPANLLKLARIIDHS